MPMHSPAAALAWMLLQALALPASAQAQVRVEQITWLSADPPATADSASGTGLANQLVAYMGREWPEVRHTLLQANARRSWQMIAGGEHACHASMVRTAEREKQAYFTNTLVGPPLQLIVRREKLGQLPRSAAGEVDLARLLADTQLRGALIDGRSYGAHVDRLLARRPTGNPSVSVYASSDFGSKILPMLVANRADYAIEYDIALGTLRERQPEAAALVSQPIAGASEPVRAGIACPRTPWGLAAITGIDKAIGTPAGATMLRASIERWMTPELRHQYATRLDEFYRERARPSVIR